uniref:Uncharacterized protein n=1 Tax=Proteus vulgaris TaxID=585 RepID=Q8KK24_PROVU|nr:hypothetical protein [Proteus vulgaris]
MGMCPERWLCREGGVISNMGLSSGYAAPRRDLPYVLRLIIVRDLHAFGIKACFPCNWGFLYC